MLPLLMLPHLFLSGSPEELPSICVRNCSGHGSCANWMCECFARSTIFDAATSLCVLPGRERRAGHTAAAPANPSLSVNCPGADTVSCEGDTVEVDANGQCVPKGNQLSKADQLGGCPHLCFLCLYVVKVFNT